MGHEELALWAFSGFMVLVVVLLVANVLFALYRQRKARRAGEDGPPDA